MQNDPAKVAVGSFQQKLDAFKTKIEFQQLLTQALSVEFKSLTSEFESLKQQFGASLQKIESTSSNFDVISDDFESTSKEIGATSFGFESTSSDFESTSYKSESTSPDFESSSQNNGASSSIRELASLIQRSARESLKIYYSQPNIPSRMAEIVLVLRERKKLSVAQMQQITGVSRNSLVRDMKVLKLLGWLEFHGSRKNGYFTLAASCPDFLFLKGSS